MNRLRSFLTDELKLNAEELMPAFENYQRLLLEWNEKINLVSRKTESIEDHLLNSIFFLSQSELGDFHELADIGTGGGFPGVPLKLIYPKMRVTLIDSVRKKTVAIESIAAAMKLDGVQTVCSRAEELAESNEFRGRFDVITAKAVAPLDKLFKWSRNLLAEEGRMIFIKGGDTNEEEARLRPALKGFESDVMKFSFDPEYGIHDKKIFIIHGI